MFALLKKHPVLYKIIATYFLVHFISFCIIPTTVYAITSGPAQPETQAFKPMGASDMVNLFTGDFSYNVPLFELPGANGGYPFNLSYNATPNMDEEASWVGLGWNLNVGAINRNVRGLPDEFNGNGNKNGDYRDKITKNVYSTPTLSWDFSYQPFGADLNLGPVNTTAPSVTFSLSYNNHVGYNIGFDLDVVSVKLSKAFSKYELGAAYNFGVGANTGSGATISEGFTLSMNRTNDGNSKIKALNWLTGGSLGFSQTMSSRTGLVSQSLNLSASVKQVNKNLGIGSHSSSISLYRAGVAYSPSIDTETIGSSASFDLKAGKSFSGNVFGAIVGGTLNKNIRLLSNMEMLKDNGKEVIFKPFGYNHLQHMGSSDKYVLMDVNREKERVIRKGNKYLSTPNLMPDTYSVSGHGIGGTFRPFRRDVGFSHDNYSSNETFGSNGGFGYAGSPSLNEFSGSYGVNFNKSSSSKWKNGNGLDGSNKFRFRGSNSLKIANRTTQRILDENIYFKLFGENTLRKQSEINNIGGNKPWKPSITSSDNLKNEVNIGAPTSISAEQLMQQIPQERAERNTYIQPIYNEMITKAGVAEQVLREYSVTYKDVNGNDVLLSRNPTEYLPHHIGGFTVQNTDGTRYIYALPVYNIEEIEYNYSINSLPKSKQAKTVPDKVQDYVNTGGEKYMSKQTTSRYPYAYMLTAVIGADYVDTDNEPGPSDGDAGYWVKFIYQKTSSNYQWRAPFKDANYIKGQYNVLKDDKAAFTTGSKEIYYLYSAETVSHKAEFITSDRLDGRGVSNPYGDYNESYLGDKQKRLEAIKLFSKIEKLAKGNNAVPITTVHLSHTYELCKGVANNENTVKNINKEESGKLTLKKLAFSYENNSRGKLSPYEFNYTSSKDLTDIKKENPDYNSHATDRWGTYKKTDKLTANGEEDMSNYYDFPYTSQDKNYERDVYAGAWSIKSINLPSGATIEVNYESDDYAYVQDKQAMQMYEIAGVDKPNSFEFNVKNTSPKIYFKLPEEVQAMSNNEFDEYLQGFLDNAPVYIKTMIRLKNTESSYELVSGYMETGTGKIGFTNDRKYAYVFLKPSKGYHPLSASAWQHIQTAQPQIIYFDGEPESPGDENSSIWDIITQMHNIFPRMIKEISKGYYELAASKNWGNKIRKGWIRLNNVTGKKYGGGSRVKRVLIKDNWRTQAGEEAVYGQVYDYTIPHPNNPAKLISSGVAAFEPVIGGEENALKYAIKEHPDVVASNAPDYFFDAPVNESHYSSPSVGYQQVRVKSLASAALAKESSVKDLAKYFGSQGQFAASGEVVHEFYTAKDFPVITKESPIQIETPNVTFWEAITSVKLERTTGAGQGFSVEINDMHGKQKAVTYYAQNLVGEVQKIIPVSWVRYYYQVGSETINGKDIQVLNSNVPVILADPQLTDPQADKPVIDENNYILGVDYDLFADAREYNNTSTAANLSAKIGVSVTPPFVTTPSFSILPIPITYRTDGLRVVTFNKVIHRTGILKTTEAFDGGATVTTSNLYWSKNGDVIVTSVDNNFKDKVFTYNIPAHFVYDLTGFAALGQGLEPTIKVGYNNVTKRYVLDFASNGLNSWKNLFALGDEWHIQGRKDRISDENILALPNNLPTQKWIVAAINPTSLEFEFIGDYNTGFTEKFLTTLIYRSGRRNQLSAQVGNITVLGDKTITAKKALFENRVLSSCIKNIEMPKCINN